MALTGLVGLSGVVVNDSLVLVSHLNDLRDRRSTDDIYEVIAEGTAHRTRAIIMTTLSTVAGVIPLVYGWGGTDPFMAPMA